MALLQTGVVSGAQRRQRRGVIGFQFVRVDLTGEQELVDIAQMSTLLAAGINVVGTSMV